MMRSLIVAAGALLAGCEQQASAPAETTNEMAAANSAGATGTADTAAADESPLAIAAADPGLKWGSCPEGMPEGCGIAVLHGDPAKPNADIFLRVPGGAAIPPHAHSSAERMILVGGELEVEYQGASAETLRAGDYAYGPARLAHRATCRSAEPCTLFIAFEGPVDVLPAEGSLD